MSVLWLAVLTIVLAALQAAIFRIFNLKKLSYNRRFSVKAGYEGQKCELLEEIKNEKPLPVPWLRAESRIPRELSFEKEKLDAHEVSGGLYHKSLFFLAPMNALTRHHEITFKRRGVYYAGSVALTAGDLFALSRCEEQLELDCGITVYPRILDRNELPDPANRWLGDTVVKRWIMPDPFLVNGIREYRAGDSLKDIHWRASAHTGELRVKAHDYTSDTNAFIILNIQTSENQWADVGKQNVEFVENSIRIAATLCVRALETGINAGFASNACLIGEKGSGACVLVPAAGGSQQAQKLLDTMAKMLLIRETNFHTYLEALARDIKGQDILVITPYVNTEIEKATDMLKRENTVNFFIPERGAISIEETA